MASGAPHSFSQVLHSTLEHFIAARSGTRQCRANADIWLQTDPLKLASVRVANVLTRKPRSEPAGQNDGADVPVGPRCWRPDYHRAVCRLEQKTSVLGLTCRPLVDE